MRLLILLLFAAVVTSYRLNHPRLLLPYHPSTPVRHLLEVTHPSNGCFFWRSTRAHDVSVRPLDPHNGCSDRAEVSTTAKVAGNVSAVIFANDPTTGTTLSCDVSIDHIAHVKIDTTTMILYVDAAPARMIVTAYNDKGATFSTLGELEFDWEVKSESNAAGERPIRIVPFEQSKYEAPPDIVALETRNKKGYMVLLEGLATGSAQLSTRLADSYYSKLEGHALDLVVVANLLLLPSQPLLVPIHSEIEFSVLIIRQQSTEVVPMPSSSYFLRVDDPDVCDLEVSTSHVTALKKGHTEVSLLSQYVDVKMQGVSPPSTSVEVTDPESLRFAVSGQNWLLEVGRTYVINVNMYDQHDVQMFIAGNTRFDTIFPPDHFSILSSTKNHTHFEVTALRAGKVTLTSKFVSIIQKGGIETMLKHRVTGEQSVEVVDPIRIEPEILYLPYLPSNIVEFPLKARGGSGVFSWSSADAGVAAVDGSSGVVRGGKVGGTQVTAIDRRNEQHSAHAQIVVVSVSSIGFGHSRWEAVEGGTLHLNVQLFGVDAQGHRVVISDCREADIRVTIADPIFLSYKRQKRVLPSIGTGCASIPLDAVQSGNTKVTVSFEGFTATTDVSVYPPLTSSVSEDLLLSLGSSFGINLIGGPRPWILDPSKHYTNGKPAKKLATINFVHETGTLKCGTTEGELEVLLSVGNEATPSNPFPASESITIRVCCATATRLSLATHRPNARKDDLPACPANTRSMFVTTPTRLQLTGYGRCGGSEERTMHSISALKVSWSSSATKLLTVSEYTGKEVTNDGKAYATAHPKGVTGDVRVSAESASPNLKANIDLNLVDRASADPSSLVLWNDKSVRGVVEMHGGSGHFHVKTATSRPPFDHSNNNNKITIVPTGLGTNSLLVHDLCIDGSVIEIPVKVRNIDRLVISGPNYLEVGGRVDISVDAVDEDGDVFSPLYLGKMDIQLSNTSNIVRIEKVSSQHFWVWGSSIGQLSVVASSSKGSLSLTSRPHSIQVFAPILLFPKLVTLVPESTFQLEVVGGPQPTPPISFALNNTKILEIEPNALMMSQHLGYTSVTGTVTIGDGLETKDSVVVRVVSLTGVRIAVSSVRVERGHRVWARLEGIDDGETPFAFGGATYPFTVKWVLGNGDVFRLASPLGDSFVESDSNRFSTWLEAIGVGKSALSVVVDVHPHAREHFRRGTRFEHKVNLAVTESFSLTSPELPSKPIVMAPGSSLPIESSWVSSSVSYSIPSHYSSLLSVSPKGILTSLQGEGIGAVMLAKKDKEGTSTVLFPVEVVRVASLDVSISPPFVSTKGSYLSSLPFGSTVSLSIIFRDVVGRILHSSASTILYRPHRFDLTTIKASNSNKTLTVKMHSAGETVLKIWDGSDPSISSFLRLSASDSLAPSQSLLVSDVVCFKSPLADARGWQSDEKKTMSFLDDENGIAVAKAPGASTVFVYANDDNQLLYTKVSVSSPTVMSFVDQPGWVSNIDETPFVFPISIGWNGTHRETSAIDCPESLWELVSSKVVAPLECGVSFPDSSAGSAVSVFHTRAIFDPKKGQYACVVEKQMATTGNNVLFGDKPIQLMVTATWTGQGKVASASENILFHPAFVVEENELSVSNLLGSQSSLLSLRVPPHLSSDVRIHPCGDYITIHDLAKPPEGTAKDNNNKWFELKLNTMSPSLWKDMPSTCSVVVESTRTNQRATVPLKINLHGDAMKAAYETLGGRSGGFLEWFLTLLSNSSQLILSMLVICTISVVTILVYIRFFGRETSGYAATGGNTSAFLSDRSYGSISPTLEWSNSIGGSANTPRRNYFTSTPSGQRVGSSGSPLLWSNGDAVRPRN